MTRKLLTVAVITAALGGGIALADEDCYDPVADWQPREQLRQQLEAQGWTVYRIKIDEGCYEVNGVDARGNRVEASFSPASLQSRGVEYDDEEDDEDEDEEGYEHSRTPSADRGNATPNNGIVKSRPSVSIQ
ncbi:PepSY domain-containing protein [Marinobacteraceae bacterium S3BR75-40.1]